ncbi:MAG: hypothetical protein ACM3ZV_07680 [Bacillota bacterium]
MIISAVLAVALGIAPVKDSRSPQLVQVDEAKVAAQIGRYEQFVGKDGKTHIRGFDRAGRSYDLTIDRNNHVQGQVGDWYVDYHFAAA